MVSEKIRKSEVTLLNLFSAMIIGIIIFTGLYLLMYKNVIENDIPLDTKYSDSFDTINGSLTSRLENNINNIKSSVNNITEADSAFQVAINGFKGLGSVLLLPLNLITISIEGFQTVIEPLDFMPKWLVSLLIALVTIIIFIVIIASLKGEGGTL